MRRVMHLTLREIAYVMRFTLLERAWRGNDRRRARALPVGTSM